MNTITNLYYFGEVSALSAALFWSIAVIIFKSASTELSPYLITVLKNSIATICFLFLFLFLDIPLWYAGFDTIEYIKIIISGILGMGLADIIFLYALSQIGANRIALVNCSEPVVIYILSSFFLGTVLNQEQFLGFIIVLIAILIMTYEKDIDNLDIFVKRKGIALQFLAVMLSASGIVLIKPILNNVADNIELQLWITAFRLFPGMLIAWLILFYQNNTRNLFKPLKQSKLLIKIIISSGLGTFIALSFWIVGYAHIEHPPIASLLGQTSVIFITVLSVVFLKEKLTKIRILSIALAVCGVYLTSFYF